MSTFNLEIITPQKIAYTNSEVGYLAVPGSEGILGILPNHAPLFALLTDGELVITTKEKEPIYMAIGGGFIEIHKNKVTVLVTRAAGADQISETEAKEAMERAERLLKEKPEGTTLNEALSLYRRALIDLKVVRRRTGIRRNPQEPIH